MDLSSDLCMRITKLKELSIEDKKQLQMLLLDFLAAVCAGYKSNIKFNSSVEKVLFSAYHQLLVTRIAPFRQDH